MVVIDSNDIACSFISVVLIVGCRQKTMGFIKTRRSQWRHKRFLNSHYKSLFSFLREWNFTCYWSEYIEGLDTICVTVSRTNVYNYTMPSNLSYMGETWPYTLYFTLTIFRHRKSYSADEVAYLSHIPIELCDN